jgi:zinc/manganese transport system permease protein
MILIAAASGSVAGYTGLVLSFHTGVPSGPAITWSPACSTPARSCSARDRRAHPPGFPGRHLEA